ncbi:hypothetical protein POM88_031517 [Heracleum sosnowskyi]|uniref:Uncharacterized protein n=1 Tax=Heracleum sosnowskyi TaxID=360622 RepID=A0AAD8HXL1_9APIA|nr:hypothetical protein POM88_031517 [Heracleum sosnowskyi]
MSLASTCYSDREALLSLIRNLTATLGYITVIKKSKRDRYVRVGCDRGGEYRANRLPVKRRVTNVKRVTETRLINYPFKIWGRWKAIGKWEIEIKNLTHNHPPSKDLFGHPSYRRFTKEEFVRIQETTILGITPKLKTSINKA